MKGIETIILISASVIFIISFFFIPKGKRHEAQFVFLFIQFPTWLLGLVTVEAGLLKYPVHELGRANSTSFVFEYLILPIYCIHINAHYPQSSSFFLKTLYYCGLSLVMTAVEILVERYTDILEYTGWHWYYTFISILLLFLLSRVTTLWFFKTHRPDTK